MLDLVMRLALLFCMLCRLQADRDILQSRLQDTSAFSLTVYCERFIVKALTQVRQQEHNQSACAWAQFLVLVCSSTMPRDTMLQHNPRAAMQHCSYEAGQALSNVRWSARLCDT